MHIDLKKKIGLQWQKELLLRANSHTGIAFRGLQMNENEREETRKKRATNWEKGGGGGGLGESLIAYLVFQKKHIQYINDVWCCIIYYGRKKKEEEAEEELPKKMSGNCVQSSGEHIFVP